MATEQFQLCVDMCKNRIQTNCHSVAALTSVPELFDVTMFYRSVWK